MNNEQGSILYIPIQINGGTEAPIGLKERELYVLDNGTLYVGKKNENGTVEAVEVAGRVINGAEIAHPTLLGSITLGEGVAPKGKVGGRLMFVDDTQYELPDTVSNETVKNAIDSFVRILDNIEQNGSSGGATQVVQIIDAEVE